MQGFTYTIEMFVLFSELLGLTWRRKNMDELSWLLQWLASMETLAKQIIGDEWRLILIFTQLIVYFNIIIFFNYDYILKC